MEAHKEWNYQHAWMMLIGALWTLITGYVWVLSLWAVLSFGRWVWDNREALAALKPWGGYANWVTGTRLLLLVALSIAAPFLSDMQFFLLVIIPLSMDALDGYLARRFGQSTYFGQYFDMETDAFYVLLLCFLLYSQQKTGVWILIPGLLRYVYVLAINALKWQDREEKGTFLEQIIGAGFFVVLAMAFIMPDPLGAYVLAIPATMVIGSFAYSFYGLWQRGKKNSNVEN